jgi:hypothetical protein
VRFEKYNRHSDFNLPGEQEALSGAGDGDDAKDWSGELPSNAEYVIVVGGTRGNASYTLKVSIAWSATIEKENVAAETLRHRDKIKPEPNKIHNLCVSAPQWQSFLLFVR